MKKIVLKLTEKELLAICDITDTISGMIGGGGQDFNDIEGKNVKTIDKMLKKNGYKRAYK
jgi:hypothetical protein